jgi:hypothetical protein
VNGKWGVRRDFLKEIIYNEMIYSRYFSTSLGPHCPAKGRGESLEIF